ncbi:S41 family peptidase [Pararcticibacter amylolyticus]|uniref:Peptidase S41 n=1 Tax=Pararcticibacter amylolyticus TaxID=2173175 RepID=A0A2U2PHJ2_9SPHI|nr:S41 family peptidase [Pararcticibacter amylolyticus]PWG80732.1 peptidase S41 [Pararcticibacter amylolyticus]
MCIDTNQPFLKLLFLLFIVPVVFAGCKKNSHKDEIDQETLLKDSVYLYTQEVYLWQDALPAKFYPQNYSTAEDVLTALKQYKKGSDGQPVDHYSFLDREGTVAGEIQDGVLGDFGFDIRYESDPADLRVKLVYEGSPAWNAGIRRSWRIVKVNGNAAIDYNTMKSQNFKFILDALSAKSITLTLQKPDGTQVDKTLNSTTYSINPVLYSNVYERAGKKIGYIVFNSFVSISNLGVPTLTKNKIDAAFASFRNAGVSEMVVDLRYNGGGSVETAEYLTDLLAPVSANGKVMYSYRLNKTLTSYTQTSESWKKAFASVMISTNGSLALNKVYFIVTEGTASASELLINNLKPYISDIKVIGEGRTYGKPVGFFPITIFDADLYAVSFETLNANNQGEYYSGIPVSTGGLEGDDLTKDWGDEDEDCLEQALYYAQNGSFKPASTTKTSSSSKASGVASGISINKALDARGNKDMYLFKRIKE